MHQREQLHMSQRRNWGWLNSPEGVPLGKPKTHSRSSLRPSVSPLGHPQHSKGQTHPNNTKTGGRGESRPPSTPKREKSNTGPIVKPHFGDRARPWPFPIRKVLLCPVATFFYFPLLSVSFFLCCGLENKNNNSSNVVTQPFQFSSCLSLSFLLFLALFT